MRRRAAAAPCVRTTEPPERTRRRGAGCPWMVQAAHGRTGMISGDSGANAPAVVAPRSGASPSRSTSVRAPSGRSWTASTSASNAARPSSSLVARLRRDHARALDRRPGAPERRPHPRRRDRPLCRPQPDALRAPAALRDGLPARRAPRLDERLRQRRLPSARGHRPRRARDRRTRASPPPGARRRSRRRQTAGPDLSRFVTIGFRIMVPPARGIGARVVRRDETAHQVVGDDAAGSRTTKVAPSSGVPSIAIEPPWASITLFAM